MFVCTFQREPLPFNINVKIQDRFGKWLTFSKLFDDLRRRQTLTVDFA